MIYFIMDNPEPAMTLNVWKRLDSPPKVTVASVRIIFVLSDKKEAWFIIWAPVVISVRQDNRKPRGAIMFGTDNKKADTMEQSMM